MNERSEQNFAIAALATEGVEMFTECGAGATKQGEGASRICAWCGRFDLGCDCWVEVDAVPLEMVEQLTHGVCPDCFNDFLDKRPLAGASSTPVITMIPDAAEPGVRPWWLPD